MSTFEKIYNQIIKEDVVIDEKATLIYKLPENDFYSQLQQIFNQKLVKFYDSHVQNYENMIKDDSEFMEYVKEVEKVIPNIKSEIDQIISTANSMVDKIKNRDQNLWLIDYNVHADNLNQTYYDWSTIKQVLPDMFTIYSLGDLIDVYQAPFREELIAKNKPLYDAYSNIRSNVVHNAQHPTDCLSNLSRWLRSNITKFKDAHPEEAMRSVDTGFKDFFNQPLYVNDKVILLGKKNYRKDLAVGVITKASGTYIIVDFHFGGEQQINTMKIDGSWARYKVVSISRLDGVMNQLDNSDFAVEM